MVVVEDASIMIVVTRRAIGREGSIYMWFCCGRSLLISQSLLSSHLLLLLLSLLPIHTHNTDFFRVEDVSNIALSGVDCVSSFTAMGDSILVRNYHVRYKKSGNRVSKSVMDAMMIVMMIAKSQSQYLAFPCLPTPSSIHSSIYSFISSASPSLALLGIHRYLKLNLRPWVLVSP